MKMFNAFTAGFCFASAMAIAMHGNFGGGFALCMAMGGINLFIVLYGL